MYGPNNVLVTILERTVENWVLKPQLRQRKVIPHWKAYISFFSFILKYLNSFHSFTYYFQSVTSNIKKKTKKKPII